MRRSLLSIAAASAMLAGAGLSTAQTTTTTTTQTWTSDQGNMIREYSTTKNYQSYSVPTAPAVGVEVPSNVQLYALPPQVQVQNPDQYSYTIINNEPMVVERTTRRVVHTWGP